MFGSLSLALIPLSLFFFLIVMSHRHWAVQTHEQLQVDATALSLCHQAARHFNDELAQTNRSLSGIRYTMNSIASACLASATIFPKASIAILKKCHSMLKIPSRSAAAIEKAQVAALNAALPPLQRLRLEQLSQAHQWDPTALNVTTQAMSPVSIPWTQKHPRTKAFERKRILPLEESYERTFAMFGPGVEWPEELVADAHQFEKFYRFQFRYRPNALVWSQNQSGAALEKTFIGRFLAGEKNSSSACYIREVQAGRNYEVEWES